MGTFQLLKTEVSEENRSQYLHLLMLMMGFQDALDNFLMLWIPVNAAVLTHV